MVQDRRTLDQALDYVYAPDYRKDIVFPGNLDRLQTSLHHLRNVKSGIFLPFLTPIYNLVVFHNLVLPNEKIEALQRIFFGSSPDHRPDFIFHSPQQTAPWDGSNTAPPKDATLRDAQVVVQPQGPVTNAQVTLTMLGSQAWQSEFVTTIHLPEGLRDGAANLIGLSKRTGILVPDSSYIAVESPSQWRILEEKEKAKLHQKQVFELEEPAAVPEPAAWMLLIGLALLAVSRRAMSCRGNV